MTLTRKLSDRQVRALGDQLETCYRMYHHRAWIGSDPLQFLYAYDNVLDQELVGLTASSLAYGNVTAIHGSIRNVLAILGSSPQHYLKKMKTRKELEQMFRLFRHRWTDGKALAALLWGARNAMLAYGSLGASFAALDAPGADLVDTLARWVALLDPDPAPDCKPLLARPERKSACKRLHLYLRWMVRCDEIDTGCWKGLVDPSRLLIPLDTHVYRFARACGMTRRCAADGRTVREITDVLRRINPSDPVRYDFSMTRPGILETMRHDRRGRAPDE